MTVLSVNSGTGDGYAGNSSTTYSTARTGAGAWIGGAASTTLWVGQYLNGSSFECYELGLEFDTSSIPDDATITGVTLTLQVITDGSTTDSILEARGYDWGGGTYVRESDYLSGASLDAQTLLASISTSGMGTGSKALTSEAAFLSYINKTGTTKLIVANSLLRLGTQPANDETVEIASADHATAAYWPKLVVAYSESGVSFTGLRVIRHI